jgi:hypothetical protein
MTTLTKINDTTVAEVGTEEVRRLYGKTELVNRKASLESELTKVNALLAELEKI